VPFPRPAILTEREWTLVHGKQRAVVNARGGALRSYQVGDAQVIDGWADQELPPAFNGAVLAPWPNRLRDGRWRMDGAEHQLPINETDRQTALHGLVMWADWQLIRHRAASITLGCRVTAQPGYPFGLQLRVGWTLTDVGLRCDLAADNVGNQPAPFGIATHPFFGFEEHRVDELTLTLPARKVLRTDDRLLPLELVDADERFRTGLRLAGVELDTSFTGLERDPDGRCRLRLAAESASLTIWADDSFRWWQVYTGDRFPAGDDRIRRSVAIEAMTCGPDAFNTGQDVPLLEPGQGWRGSWGVHRTPTGDA
jgi:aldose 1-epimerase